MIYCSVIRDNALFRDPAVPGKLKESWNMSSSSSWEVRLTGEQEKRTVEAVTAAFAAVPAQPCFTGRGIAQHSSGADVKSADAMVMSALSADVQSGARRKRGRPSRRVEMEEEGEREEGEREVKAEEESSLLLTPSGPGSAQHLPADLGDASDHDDSDQGRSNNDHSLIELFVYDFLSVLCFGLKIRSSEFLVLLTCKS